MIVLSVALDQFRFKVAADLGKDFSKVADCQFRQHIPAVFCDKDQVRVKAVNYVPASAKIHVVSIRPMCMMVDMERMRGYVYRLAPTEGQERQFRQFAGVCRLIWNLALEQRRVWGRSHGCNFHTASADLKALRAEFDFVGEVSQTAQQQTLRDLDKAYQAFFAGRTGYPRPRRKGESDQFRFMGREVSVRRHNRRWSEIRLPKIGWVRFRDTRRMDGTIRNATIRLTALGWQVSIMCKCEVAEPTRLPGSVGIDRGVTVPLMLSNGDQFHLPASLAKLDRQHKRAQRVAARRRKGSNRWRKAIARASKLKARQARIRVHWQHQASRRIADSFGTVVLEKLRTRNMTRSAKGSIEAPGVNVKAKAGLNRSILNVGWFGFEAKLAYKLAERGGQLVRVNPAYTSQTCSACGTVDSRGRKSQASFVCPCCGFRANADLNAAINIERRWNTPLLDVEACGSAAQDASTLLAVA